LSVGALGSGLLLLINPDVTLLASFFAALGALLLAILAGLPDLLLLLSGLRNGLSSAQLLCSSLDLGHGSPPCLSSLHPC